MRLLCLGLNHHTAEVGLREKLAFSTEMMEEFIKKAIKIPDLSIHEMVILSTCNRVEIYAVADNPVFAQLSEMLIEDLDTSGSQPENKFFRLVDEQVVSHLMRVAAGLDSMVIGEPQILGQVRESYEASLAIGGSGKLLSKLFQMAIHAGKRVRTETAISRNSLSIASLAARKAAEVVTNLEEAQITLLGAGEMAELAVEALRKRGVKKFNIISRTISSACELAQQWSGIAGNMDDLSGALEATDILITSTSAPHILIDKGMVEQVMNSRPERPLAIIDIAVPRDVSADAAEVPGIQLFDIDGLNQGLEESLSNRKAEIPQVELIIEEEYQAFKEFYATLKVVPVITGMRQQAEHIRQQEVAKTMSHIQGLEDGDQERIAAMTRSIVQKILHSPTLRLRAEASGPEAEKYALAARALFGLDPVPGSENGKMKL